MKKNFTIILFLFFGRDLFAQITFPGNVDILEEPSIIKDFSLDKSPAPNYLTTKLDGPIAFFKDSLNQMCVWSATDIGQYRLRTNDFTNIWVDWSWGRVFESSDDFALKNFNYKEWIMAPYTTDGKKYYGLIHNEYHAWEDPSSKYFGRADIWDKLWYNGITFAQSIDGGKRFTQPSPPDGHIALCLPEKYNTDTLHRQGFFNPSNIIYNKKDGYYYSMVLAWPLITSYQQRGICVIRTKTIDNPKSWRGWNGVGFTVADTLNPYTKTITEAQKKARALKPVIKYGFTAERLSFNTYFNQFMLVGHSKGGFSYALSTDLVNWTYKKLIYPMNGSGTKDTIPGLQFGDYPSIIDPQDTSRNFEYTGRDVYLYYSRAGGGEMGSKLYRMKIRFNLGTPPQTSFVVNSNSDDDDDIDGNALPLTSKGEVTLRSILAESNNRYLGFGWADSVIKITFASGINKIKLDWESMEQSYYPISIDGFQNGGNANSQNFNQGMNLVPGVEIDCNNFSGLFINGGNSTIRGLNIYNYSGDGGISLFSKGNNKIEGCIIGADKTGTIYKGSLSAISIEDSPNNTIGGLTNGKRNLLAGGVYISGLTSINNLVQGNYIGTDISGLNSIGNPGPGIQLSLKANLNSIGGTQVEARNLISGNAGNGVEIFGAGTSKNKIFYNFIGVDRTGQKVLGNKGNGVEIDDNAAVNYIGQASAGNIIGGNGNGFEAGVYLNYANDNNLIQSNFIGTDSTQTFSLPNKLHGIAVGPLSNLNKIGSTTNGTGNVIANNDGVGIMLENDNTIFSNSFVGNSIYNNKNLDIDLGNNGISKNDSLDKDLGPNLFINYPVLESISLISNGINIKGTMSSEASKIYFIEFFSSNFKRSPFYGNGKKVLGNTTVTTNTTGVATFDVNLTGVFDTTEYITSTATQLVSSAHQSTSEFSQQLKVGASKIIIANNSAPKITNKPILPFVVRKGELFSYKFNFSDKDTILGDEIIWSVSSVQNGPWFSINNGVLSGMPDDDGGNVSWWDANVKVTDLGNLSDNVDVELIVNPSWPRITSTPNDTISPATPQNYQIVIKDSLGNLQTGFIYTVITNPGFVTVSTAGLVKIAPVFQHSGKTFDVVISANKGLNKIYQFWKIEVKNVNIAPLWENSRVVKIPGTTTQTYFISPGYDTTIHKDSLITFRCVPASDYNSSDTLIYTYHIYDNNNILKTSIVADKYDKNDSIKYGARETRCVLKSDIGKQLQVDQLHEVRVSVTDGKVIANIPPPYPRFRVTSGTTQTANISVSASQFLFGNVVIGNNSTAQNFSASGTNLSGNISVTPPTGFEIRMGTNAFSSNVINLTPSNATVNQTTIDVRFAPTTAQQYSGDIIIASTNAVSKKIVVSGTGTATAVPSVTLSDTLLVFGNVNVGTISQSQSFTILGNNLSDTLKITPPNFYEIRTGTNEFSSNQVIFIPSNGQVNSSIIDVRFKPNAQQDFFDTIKISSPSVVGKYIIVRGSGIVNTNNPPKIISVATTTVFENNLYSYQVVATDPDTINGDKLFYSFETKPSWLSISSTGLVSGTPIRKNVGDTLFIVKVSDSQGSFVTQKTVLKILYVNNPPTIISKSDSVTMEGSLYSYQVITSDLDSALGDKVAITLDGNPSWLSISNSGLVSGTPIRKNVGDTTFIITATDNQNATATQTVKLKIKYLNQTPTISSKADTVAFEDSLYNYQVVANDEDLIFGDKLSYSLLVKPTWMMISNNGLISGTPKTKNIGDTIFTISVADLEGLTAKQTIKLIIKKKLMSVKIFNNVIPEFYSLMQNYPNPFNPSTTIKFGLPVESNVKLEIYNSIGQLIDKLIDERLTAHHYEIKWETGKIPTGLYFYKLTAVDINNPVNKLIKTRKMLMVK